MQDVRDALLVGKASDGSPVRRPLSPHLTVYRWTPTMAGSILNRATGVALSVGSLMLVCWLVAAATGPTAYTTLQEFMHSPLGLLLLLGWTVALFYHLFAGVRHLAWDIGLGHGKDGLNRMSWVVFGATAIATVLVWALAYMRLGG